MGITIIIIFFISYRFAFISKGGIVYLWTAVQLIISVVMTILFGYVYFSLFLAFFIGNIRNKVGFYLFYGIHLAATIAVINIGFIQQNPIFLTQFPFIVICVVAVILLPFNAYNRNKQVELEDELEDAYKRIAELGKLEERQRIARDLHDTLGQKLSLIGLKSDLAGKLLKADPEKAKKEMEDIRHTAHLALKEVRDMVSEMRGVRLEEELVYVREILEAAGIQFILKGDSKLSNTPLLAESVLCMCIKEAVTNVVKHSRASRCMIDIEQKPSGIMVRVVDDGCGIGDSEEGNGLQGIRERLEFLNGSFEIAHASGSELNMFIPCAIKHISQEVRK